AVSAWRMVVPNFKPVNSSLLNFLPFIVLSLTGAITYKNIFIQQHKGSLLLACISLIFSSAVLGLTRYTQAEIHYYYSCLIFFYMCIPLAIYLECYGLKYKRLLVAAMSLVLAGLMVISFQSK